VLGGFLWDDGVASTLGNLGASNYTVPFDINDEAQVVGIARLPSYVTHPVIWEDGTPTDILPPGVNDVFGVSINDASQVLISPRGGPVTGVLWEAGVFREIALGLGSGLGLGPPLLNESGQVAGYWRSSTGQNAFIWHEGTVTDLGNLGGNVLRVSDLNEAGQVVGQSLTASGERHGFFWDGVQIHDLGTLGGSFSYALDVTETGRIVGASTTADGVQRATLWQKLTPVGTLERLKEMVQALFDEGVLNKGQANSLINKVNLATAFLNDGKTRTAISKIESFIHEVDAFMKPVDNAVLSSENGQPLLDAANFAIAELGG
jgi:probable HAF family extracellular repeat protein